MGLTILLAEEKNNALESFLRNILTENKDSGRFYNFILKRRGNSENVDVLKINGMNVAIDKERAKLLKEYFTSVINKNSGTYTVTNNDYDPDNFQIMAKAERGRIKTLKNKKSRGPDDISTESIKLGRKQLHHT